MRFTFIGCSFTVGTGLESEKYNVDNYSNIVAKKYRAKINNLAVGGNSNFEIFLSAVKEILFNTPDKIFIQWTSLNRLPVYPMPMHRIPLTSMVKFSKETQNIIPISESDLQKFVDTYRRLNHEYNEILRLIEFCNIITKLSENKTQAIFINGIIPWTEEIANKDTPTNFYKKLSDYSKEILEFDSNSDAVLIKIFNDLNNAVLDLDKSLWVNMFDSFLTNLIDYGNDNLHPGPKSHQQYADMIINYLEDYND